MNTSNENQKYLHIIRAGTGYKLRVFEKGICLNLMTKDSIFAPEEINIRLERYVNNGFIIKVDERR